MEDRKYVLGVIAGGLIGGFGSWVWASTVGPEPLIESAALAIPSYVFLGGLAGFLGVFLVARTDPKAHVHAMAFALACGLFWGPVISGAKAMVSLQESREALARTRTVAAQLGRESEALKDYVIQLQTDRAQTMPSISGGDPRITRPGESDRALMLAPVELQDRLGRINRLQAELELASEVRR